MFQGISLTETAHFVLWQWPSYLARFDKYQAYWSIWWPFFTWWSWFFSQVIPPPQKANLQPMRDVYNIWPPPPRHWTEGCTSVRNDAITPCPQRRKQNRHALVENVGHNFNDVFQWLKVTHYSWTKYTYIYKKTSHCEAFQSNKFKAIRSCKIILPPAIYHVVSEF